MNEILKICFLMSSFCAASSLGKIGDVCDIAGIIGRCEDIHSCLSNRGVLKWQKTIKLCSPNGSQIIACCRKPEDVSKLLCNAWKPYWEKRGSGKCYKDQSLIVGGEAAIVGEFPHAARIGFTTISRIRPKWICGGTLISPNFVLTAAHCVNRIGKDIKLTYHVQLGGHDRTRESSIQLTPLKGTLPGGLFQQRSTQNEIQNNKLPVEQIREVVKINQYPEYNNNNKYHDIALLQLKENVVFTSRVVPACLPTDTKLNLATQNVTAIGWGELYSDTQQFPDVLQKVAIPVVDSMSCYLNILKKKPAAITHGITTDQVCAGSDSKDTCQGDSGGPLIGGMSHDKCTEQTVFGITSFGIGCGDLGVYTRVSSYLNWITSHIAPGLQ